MGGMINKSVLQRHAKDVCLTLAQAFDAVYQKSCLDKEMASSGFAMQ